MHRTLPEPTIKTITIRLIDNGLLSNREPLEIQVLVPIADYTRDELASLKKCFESAETIRELVRDGYRVDQEATGRDLVEKLKAIGAPLSKNDGQA